MNEFYSAMPPFWQACLNVAAIARALWLKTSSMWLSENFGLIYGNPLKKMRFFGLLLLLNKSHKFFYNGVLNTADWAGYLPFMEHPRNTNFISDHYINVYVYFFWSDIDIWSLFLLLCIFMVVLCSFLLPSSSERARI